MKTYYACVLCGKPRSGGTNFFCRPSHKVFWYQIKAGKRKLPERYRDTVFRRWARFGLNSDSPPGGVFHQQICAENARARRLGAHGAIRLADIRRVFILQEGKCAYCLHGLERYIVRIDHVVPFSRGGENIFTNIALACHGCNASKWSLTISDWRRRDGIENDFLLDGRICDDYKRTQGTRHEKQKA